MGKFTQETQQLLQFVGGKENVADVYKRQSLRRSFFLMILNYM